MAPTAKQSPQSVGKSEVGAGSGHRWGGRGKERKEEWIQWQSCMPDLVPFLLLFLPWIYATKIGSVES